MKLIAKLSVVGSQHTVVKTLNANTANYYNY